MSKPKPPMPKALSRFTAEGGVTGDITATVTMIKELILKADSKLGKKGEPFRCNVQLTDDSAEMWLEVWVPEADLPFKLMDTISINEVHNEYNDHFKSYQLKTCSRSKVTIVNPSAQRKADESEFMEVVDRISTDNDLPPKVREELKQIPPTVKTQTVVIPAQPDARPYFPGMTIFELRDYHMHEKRGEIRGHIENIIMAKIREDLDTERNQLLRMIMEEEKK